ncbi:hypothetical protein LCGC14_0560010 [marine sediment metagenome]|uniref:Uncharacterized protein n=1 Tax=marine sediment metagenome TaxID=412755 RepID=A0A0F9RSC1_9ZZZZ
MIQSYRQLQKGLKNPVYFRRVYDTEELKPETKKEEEKEKK